MFNKELDDLSEELQEYVRGLQGYNFEVVFVPGRNSSLADYLSRYPAWESRNEEDNPQEERLVALAAARELSISSLPIMTDIQACSFLDNEYQEVLRCLRCMEHKDEA